MRKLNITVLGKTYEVLVEDLGTVHTPAATERKETAPAATAETADRTARITAPMAGTILSVPVKVGDSVLRGDALCTLEAMNMQNTIPAPFDGIVRSVNAAEGDSVESGDLLFVIE